MPGPAEQIIGQKQLTAAIGELAKEIETLKIEKSIPFNLDMLPLLRGWVIEADVNTKELEISAGETKELVTINMSGWLVWAHVLFSSPYAVFRISTTTERGLYRMTDLQAYIPYQLGLAAPPSGLGVWVSRYDTVNNRYGVCWGPSSPMPFRSPTPRDVGAAVEVYNPLPIPITMYQYSYITYCIRDKEMFIKSLRELTG